MSHIDPKTGKRWPTVRDPKSELGSLVALGMPEPEGIIWQIPDAPGTST